jgi:hypothetical protein
MPCTKEECNNPECICDPCECTEDSLCKCCNDN